MQTFSFERKVETKIGRAYINDTLSEVCIIVHGNKAGQVLSHNEPYQVITERQIQGELFEIAPFYAQLVGCCFPMKVAQNVHEIVVLGDWDETSHVIGSLTDSGVLAIVPTTERRIQIAAQYRARN